MPLAVVLVVLFLGGLCYLFVWCLIRTVEPNINGVYVNPVIFGSSFRKSKADRIKTIKIKENKQKDEEPWLDFFHNQNIDGDMGF